MDPLTLGMLGLTAAQMVQGIGKEQRDRKLAAATQRYSPWTGLKANPVEDANTAGTAAQGLAGASGYEQQKKVAASNDALRAAQINALNAYSNPYGRIRGSNYQAGNPAMGTGTSQPMGSLDGPWGMPQNIG